MYRILGIGELLWDLLPEGPRLGGAPANYSVMAGKLGDQAAILSRIGHDALGAQALEALRSFPVDCSQVQIDAEHPTGTVSVTLSDGQPSYIIHQPVAWDFFQSTHEWLAEAGRADAICFGSLGQRHEDSRQTIDKVLQATRPGCVKIFDVNLRAPFYSAAIVRDSLEQATVLKMNDAEAPLLLELLGAAPSESLRAGAERLLELFAGLTLVAITRGGDGSLLVSRSEWHEHAGVPAKVVDTIGAGDAFTAAMTRYLLRGASLAVLNEAGNRWGSFVASQSGAMPPLDAETLKRISDQIEG